jgi:uncharacterized membrane protein YraQ (UPF0718 family)
MAAGPTTVDAPPPAPPRARELPTLELLALLLIAAVLLRPAMAGLFDNPALQMWSTVFVSITIQALPFLVLGVAVSGAIAAFVPPGWLAEHLPKRTALAVPVAGLAGVALPGCECGSVPIAGRLTARGVSPAAAFAFMLSAPAINPVVLVATAVAFPGRPDVVIARFAASLLTAIAVGWLWARFGSESLLDRSRTHVPEGLTRWEAFTSTARHDFLHAGGWLVLGGITAATLQVVVPRSILDSLGGNELISILVMGVLAVILAICSEADAFVAVGLTQFSLTSRLVFLVVGPVVDLKLVALQAGTFGRAFAVRFAPAAFLVAVVVAVVVGKVAGLGAL